MDLDKIQPSVLPGESYTILPKKDELKKSEEIKPPTIETPIEDKVEITSAEKIIKLSPPEREEKLRKVLEKIRNSKDPSLVRKALAPFLPFIPLIPLLPKSPYRDLLEEAKKILGEPKLTSEDAKQPLEKPDIPSVDDLTEI